MRSIPKRRIERGVRELTPLSDAAQALVRIGADPDHSSADVLSIVERDAALTVRVLRIANSPLIAPMSPVESVAQAIALMGEDTVVAVALSIGASWMQEPLSGYGAGVRIFDNGLKTAIAAGMIAKRQGHADIAPLAYTGGLLHDLGKVVLSEFIEPGVADAMEAVESGRAGDWLAAERAELGVDHCEVGAMVADHFELGPALRSVIAHHHEPDGAATEYRDLVKIVHVADGMRALMGGDGSVDALAYPLDVRILEDLGLDPERFSEILCDVFAEWSTRAAAIGSDRVR